MKTEGLRFAAAMFMAAFCVGGISAETSPTNAAARVRGKHLGPEIRAKMLEIRRRNRVETGGLVYSKPEGKVFQVVNGQKEIPEAAVREAAEAVMLGTMIPVQVVTGRTEAAGAFLELVADGDAPSLVAAPEDGWAKLNVRRLLADRPDAARLKERLGKEMWRAIGAALGIGVSVYQPCLMRSVSKVGDIDACPLVRPGPATLNVFDETSRFWGIMPVRRNTYAAACREGWAPAPTNDVQRTIWEKVKADKERGPTNPITIPPPKK